MACVGRRGVDSREETLSAAGWTLLSFAATKVLTVGATVVLARLLEPSDFGVVALAALILAPVTAVSELGLRGSIVLVERDPATLAASLTLLLAAGVLGVLAIVALAAPIADLFDSHALKGVLLALSSTVLIGGVIAFYASVVQRELAFRRWFGAQLAQGVVFAAVAILAAALGAGLWSLVAGQIASMLAYAVGLIAISPYHVRPGWSRDHARLSLRVGRGFLAQRLFEHVQHNTDIAAIGYHLGSKSAGYYTISYRLADLPHAAFTEPVANAAFPNLAAMQRRGDSLRGAALEFLETVALFACPAGLLLSASAPVLITALFGAKWQPAAAPLAILGVWGALVQVEAAWGWVMNATGRAGANALMSGLILIPLAPALFLAADSGGLKAVAWTMLASAVVTGAALMVYASWRLGVPLAAQVKVLGGIAIGGSAAWGAARLVVEGTDSWAVGVGATLALATGVVTYLVTLRVVAPATLHRGGGFLRRALRGLQEGEPRMPVSLDSVQE